MIKPELVAPGGSVCVDTLVRRVLPHDPTTSVVGAGGRDANHLLATMAGTSMAAPLVTHAAARVLGRYPALTANAVRALLLVGSEPLTPVVAGSTENQTLMLHRRLTGYGRVSAERAESSEDHRVVLLGEEELFIGDVHLYVVPVPPDFRLAGRRTITLALAYDPPVRATRLDYLASQLRIFAYRDVTLDEAQNAFANQPNDQDAAADDAGPRAIADRRLQLSPANSHRARGAHHVGTYARTRPLDDQWGGEIIVTVQNTNRWDAVGAKQAYALAVAFEHDRMRGAGLYAQLHAQFAVLGEIEIEIEVEA